MLTDEYVKRVYAQVEQRDGDQPEFLQAVREVFETIQPVVEILAEASFCCGSKLSST